MGGTPSTNAIEAASYQLRKVTRNRGHFPSDEAAVKLLWLAICNIEDKRARQRQKEQQKGRAGKSATTGRLIEGAITTNWKQALQQLSLAYPDRINPTCSPHHIHKQLDRLDSEEMSVLLDAAVQCAPEPPPPLPGVLALRPWV